MADGTRRRLEIMERDNFQCQAYNCQNKTKILNVHHLDYFRDVNAWEYPSDLLITVCESCHHKENMRWKHEQHLLSSLKMKGFLVVDLVALTTAIYSHPGPCNNILNEIRTMQHG